MGHGGRAWHIILLFPVDPVGLECRNAEQDPLWPTGRIGPYLHDVFLYDDQPDDGDGLGTCRRHSPTFYQPRRIINANADDLCRDHHVHRSPSRIKARTVRMKRRNNDNEPLDTNRKIHQLRRSNRSCKSVAPCGDA